MKYKNKKKFFIVLSIILLIIIGVIFYNQKKSEGITYAQVAKIICYLDTDYPDNKEKYKSDNDILDSKNGNYWYEEYCRAVEENGLLKMDKPQSKLTYKDAFDYFESIGADKNEIDDLYKTYEHGLFKSKYIDQSMFYELIMKYMNCFKNFEKISIVETSLAGTPATLDNMGEWQVYTTDGTYTFTGIILEDKIDKTVQLITYDNEILAVSKVISNSSEYKNVWVKSAENDKVEINVYGIDRNFKINGITENVNGVLADIVVEKGSLKQINTKTDTVSGMVMSVTDKYVEIQGYGKIDLDDHFMIYDINNGFSVKKYTDIVVGYSLQNFIVAQGKVCGAVINRPLTAQNIRVLLKSTGFKSLFHESVSVVCDKDCVVKYGTKENVLPGGTILDIQQSEKMFDDGRIELIPSQGGKITVLNIKRSQGNPSYAGNIEIAKTNDGIVMINDIDIEEYLRNVVPSEMPSEFCMEALKTQAVCARSYAYMQLENNTYSEYGAHIDDSTQYQVYNNTISKESSDEAIIKTKGQVLKYNGNVVRAYYYSTSCGSTTDASVWGSSIDSMPYYKDVRINKNIKMSDLSDEKTFEQFITNSDIDDYDSQYGWYRWHIDIDINDLSSIFNSNLSEKYSNSPSKVLKQDQSGDFKAEPVKSVGQIQSVNVLERTSGGAAFSVVVKGTENTVKLMGESCIRNIFGNQNTDIITNNGTAHISMLPSSFCIFRQVYNDGKLTGIKIIGGGYGHGIGMSQNAAQQMALSGMSYINIINVFYPGTYIE